MKTLKLLAIALVAAVAPTARGAEAGPVLDLLDLGRPGLEEVARLHAAGQDSAAAAELLHYYKERTGVTCTGVNLDNIKLSKEHRRWADEALEHKFFVHDGYQPSYFYGDDIDWQYWPVRDNELRWQLHRTKWWVPMGKAYRLTGDEKYAREWTYQYLDWIKKNPLTKFEKIKDKKMEKEDNVYFAWRPLEVGDRLEHQIEQFALFLPSPSFDADFLIDFLDNYHRHADFVANHFSKQGNHLLFEAQRLLFAGAYFPEFKEAAAWRKAGVDVLNREIAKQVYDDGMQYELDFGYHAAAINIFAKAMRMMDVNGYRGEFPRSFTDTLEKMIMATLNTTYPDYTWPMFSDCKLHTKKGVLPNFKSWSRIFPDNKAVRYFATEGRKGALPDYTSHALLNSGFYVLRSGWDPEATVMIFKAGPKGEWHNQFDNGTFELWHAGRNFFPDSGSFIYGGDEEVLRQRNWFRSTAVHNTLTLDDKTLEVRESKPLKWSTSDGLDLAVVETPGYKDLTHRRAVFFVDDTFYVIADEAYGPARGDVALHYNLVECEPVEDSAKKTVSTAFADGNNITMRVFGADRMTSEEGWVSRAYRKKEARPAYAFRTDKKSDKPVRMLTVIYPTKPGSKAPAKIEAAYKGKFSPDGAAVEVKIDGKKYNLHYNL